MTLDYAHASTWTFPDLRTLLRFLRLDWRYAATDARDLRIDLLRGFAVFAMVADHLRGASWLYLITGGNTFWVSAAEGFVFLAGTVAGMVYGAIARKDGLRAAQSKALSRAATLYGLTVTLTLLFGVISAQFNLPWAIEEQDQDPWRVTFQIVTLHRTMYLVDVLVLYIFLMLGAAAALWLLHHRRTVWLLAGSVVLWASFQFAPGYFALPWNIVGNPTFHFAAWQLLFFLGMALGYHRSAVDRAFRQIPRRPYFVVSALLFILLLQAHGLNTSAETTAWFAKESLALGRLISCAIVFQFVYLAMTLLWKPIYQTLGWLLLPLGQNALYAYTLHLVLVALVYAIFQTFHLAALETFDFTGVQLAAVVAIWAATSRRLLFSIVPH